MNTEINHNSILKILILVCLFSTLIHNIDNYVHFDQYPQPGWITPGGIIRSWSLWTISGVAGYLLYKDQRFWLCYICLLIYSTCGLSSLVHYLYGSLDEFSFFMHLFILTDGFAGAAILGFTLWSGLILKEGFRSARV